MKKILLMLAMMLPCLGAWAVVAQPETGVYVISGDENGRRGNLAACQGITNFPALSNINWPGQNYHNNSVSAIENGEHWYVLKVANRYVIYNLGINKYLVKDGNNINFGDTPYLWEVLVNGEYNSIYDEAGTFISFQCGKKPNATTRNINFNNSSTDGGSWHTFTTVADGATTYAKEINTVNANAPEELSCELTDEFGNVYTGTFAGYVNEDPSFASISMSSPKWENKKFYANIAFTFPVSNAAVKNQVTISPFQGDSFKYYVSESNVKVTSAASVTNHLWEIYPSFTNGEFVFQIKNVATDKYIVTALGANTDPAQNNVNVTDSEGTLFTFSSPNQFRVKDKCVYLSTHSSSTANQWATVWSTHNGTKNKITTVNTIYNRVNYILTDIAGNTYTINNVEGTVGDEPVFTGAEGYTLSNQVWDANTLNATINFPFLVSSETKTNLITIGQGTWGDPNGADAYAKMWTVVSGNVKVVNGTPTLGTAQWLIYPILNDTKFGFKIKSASTGKFITADLESGNDAEATNTPVELTEEGTEFSFIGTSCGSDKGFAYTKNNSKTMYLTRNGSGDNEKLLGVHEAKSSHHGNGVRFPEFRQYQVVIGEAGYTTVYAPFTALTNDPQYNPDNFSNGNFVEIYTIAEQEVVNDKVQLTQMSYYIPRGQAAILKGNKGTYVFTKSNDDEEDYNAETQAVWALNKLEGSSVNTYVAGDAYVLGVIDEEVGLYKAELNKNANGANGESHFLNNAGKAYLPATAIIATQGVLRFNFGGNTTAIESVLNNGADANAPIYDLTGRRVVNAVKGGIYIQNGKKFIVK